MRNLFLFLLFLVPLISNAQQAGAPSLGNTGYLDYKMSYKTIRLRNHVSTLDLKYLHKISDKPDESGCTLYSYTDPDLLNFGNGVILKRIQLKMYMNFIASIYLICDKSDGSKIKEVFKTAYGKEFQENQFLDNYAWVGTLASVYLTYEDSDLSAAIYSHTMLNSMITDSKNKSAAKAASDL